MRKYDIDSPQARARIVAVALLADGALDQSELDLVAKHAFVERLGMRPDDFDEVVHEFCSDMLQYAVRDGYGELELDQDTIDALLGEIRNRDLQKLLLRTILEIAYADRRLSDGEAVLASLAMSRWEIDLHEVSHGFGRPPRPARRRAARAFANEARV